MNEPYQYTECGLQNVFVDGINCRTDDAGNEDIFIPAINALHKAIALGIISHKHGMSGEELRFLRTEMGYTQAELAIIAHIDKQTIGRWERGEFDIESSAETVIRLLAIEKLSLKVNIGVDELAKRSVPSVPIQPINIKKSNDNGQYELLVA